MPEPISVLLVEDSPVALEIIDRLLTSSPDIKVVGKARNGKEALNLIAKLQPKVICTDLHMKEMDGLELTKQVMENYPRPILVISTSVQKEDTNTIFELLQAGAVDVFPKPNTGLASDYEQVKRDLINKIKILSGVTVFTRRQALPLSNFNSTNNFAFSADITRAIKVITIGTSTGGPQAVHKIIAQLPANLPVPVICTQHISQGFLQGLVDWLDSECKVKVKIAQVGEMPVPGTVYFAPDQNHLELDTQGNFIYGSSIPVDGHCPSVTVTFKSVAKFYGKATMGILLTGMGKDGALGMQAISTAGGITIAQDEKTCVVFGMPSEAIALGVVQQVLPIQDIAPLLLKKLAR
ncbi:chemotaxis-specific protein-glutamate methyltransferase CheB [Synechocystis sp. PCC 7509]|uniref:chemotaxis-specific protein-glutamate methyltransferase CheB n=1 Tax=Synechocystis sp. PCC 7509 TaxID=927677 RepID=UPI0002AC2C6A|nr:chemotaxis-specific protein-glutamate methyltransferase CheB [Synechocystis sp. PCC 7509]